MSTRFCTYCGNIIDPKNKFCIFCGKNLHEETTETYQPVQRELNTFFCPSCKHENSINNFQCNNCGEDFSKYNIRASFSDTSVSRKAKAKDFVAKEYKESFGIDQSSRKFPWYIVTPILILVSGAIIFVIWYIWRAISTGC
ncbi:MAG: zinc ribbon domain-containing protein [Candidatus Heimdallarchaeota archaeon]|nr:zinc ribbon domain-containing protein [Candidatus Heimdallarchaeota archaeon]MCK4878212.1 zinc ribbon domain-containing protein [Candidatus Heimdallarchaeota archaeon]